MSAIKRWYIGVFGGEAQARPCSPAELEIIHSLDGRYFVLDEDFDRVTAERDALQERLNAADQRADDLETQLAATEQSRRAWFDSSQAAEKRIEELTRGDGEQVALMPVERSYDVRARQIIAFNTSKQAGEDLDDNLGAAYKAALRYTPCPVRALLVLPFAEKVIRKLQRFHECTDDGQGADIGRHWFDLLTQLALLNRVQRSPALWELSQQGEDCLAAAAALNTSQ